MKVSKRVSKAWHQIQIIKVAVYTAAFFACTEKTLPFLRKMQLAHETYLAIDKHSVTFIIYDLTVHAGVAGWEVILSSNIGMPS